jgi:DNA polymerase-3 subunit alpha
MLLKLLHGWEGLHGQDLQPVGLIKFDLLVISNLLQIARCCDLIKRRHKIEGILHVPANLIGQDVNAWRSDPKALEMANRGDMKCIFQYDSEGIRKLVKDGGVDRFEDLVAYASLYRPGCLSMGMHDRYVERKRGREKYSIHPLMKPILEKTYGVMVYQEQIMKILHVVGNIPLKDCEIVRKAISKKEKLNSLSNIKRCLLSMDKKICSLQKKKSQSYGIKLRRFLNMVLTKSCLCIYLHQHVAFVFESTLGRGILCIYS